MFFQFLRTMRSAINSAVEGLMLTSKLKLNYKNLSSSSSLVLTHLLAKFSNNEAGKRSQLISGISRELAIVLKASWVLELSPVIIIMNPVSNSPQTEKIGVNFEQLKKLLFFITPQVSPTACLRALFLWKIRKGAWVAELIRFTVKFKEVMIPCSRSLGVVKVSRTFSHHN